MAAGHGRPGTGQGGRAVAACQVGQGEVVVDQAQDPRIGAAANRLVEVSDRIVVPAIPVGEDAAVDSSPMSRRGRARGPGYSRASPRRRGPGPRQLGRDYK